MTLGTGIAVASLWIFATVIGWSKHVNGRFTLIAWGIAGWFTLILLEH